jgi:hypothetical protein
LIHAIVTGGLLPALEANIVFPYKLIKHLGH